MKWRYTLLALLLSFAHILYAQAPIEFIENKGQWGDWFLYRAPIRGGGDVCLERDGFRFILADKANNSRLDSFHHGQTRENPKLRFHVYKATFVGAITPVLSGERPQAFYYNYFLGNDPQKWKSNIHPCRAVNYEHIYKGIDMHVTSEKGNVVYDLIVQPGADASQILLQFKGQDDIAISKHNLVISTSVGQVTEMKPYAYQYINGEKTEVSCEYSLNDNGVLSFSMPHGYDHSERLIIDPTVVFSTLTGSTADNWGYTATYDNDGNFYAGGLVNCTALGTHFPVSPGAFQTTWGGGYGDASPAAGFAYAADISIIKYNPTGTTRLYATYLGGSQNEHAHSMIVDADNNLIVAGRTMSHNYPTTASAYRTSNAGDWDMVITKLNPAGTALVASTYIGGSGPDGVNYDSTEYGYGQLKHNYGDDSRSEVQVDKLGNIYVAGSTSSTDFPVTSTAISASLHGLQDAVAIKLNATLSSLIWSTYIGGAGSDAGYVLAFDSSQQHVYIAGGTNSSDFPVMPGAWQPSYGGDSADGFVLKFQNSSPYTLLKGTYVGTSGYDQIYGIQTDNSNHVFVMGQSIGGVFPVTPGVYSNPNSSQFAMELDNNLSTDMASTVFGSGNSTYTNISPTAFLVDTCNNIYISGWGGDLGITGSTTGPCTGMPTTSDALRSVTDGRDFYFIVFGDGFTTLRFASFYGRDCSVAWEGEHVDGGTSRFDKHGIIYQAICANCGGTGPGSCPGFPTTPGVWSMVDSSSNCNEAALKIAFNIGPVHVSVIAGPATSGCAPLTVDFTNNSVNGLTYLWDFGDGSPTTTTFAPTHTYTAGGTYTVTISAANSNACFVTNDTAHIVITVDTNTITPGFTYTITDSCGPYVASFTNTSTTHISGTPTTYTWYYGDGSSSTGATPGSHNYPDTGMYTVTLVMDNASACKHPDTVTENIHIYGLRVAATFNMPDSMCVGGTLTPNVTGTNIAHYNWTFDGSHTSTSGNPSFTYTAPGTYTVVLIAQNSAACNGADTFSKTITILPAAIAAFTFSPTTPVANVPTTYTNLSINAVRYLWEFGDSSSSTVVNPVHQFNRTGYYQTCLTAYSSANCPSKVCKSVPADVVPIVGLPTAFSPNGDGENDILYVRGAAIKTMDLKIYNRWGQLVFESTSQDKGWDGTFNGQPQPIEAYGYVLQVSFIDGSAKVLKGNITLLR